MGSETWLGTGGSLGLVGSPVATALRHPETPFESIGITYPFVLAQPRSPKNVEIKCSGIEVGCIVTPVIVGRGRNLHLGIEIWRSVDMAHRVSILVLGVGLEGVGREKLIFGTEGTTKRYKLVESA